MVQLLAPLLADRSEIDSEVLPFEVNGGLERRSLTRRRISKSYYQQIARVALRQILIDSLSTLLCVVMAYLAVSSTGIAINHFLPFAACTIVVNLTSIWSVGLYPGLGIHPANELRLLFRGASVGSICLFAVLFTSTSFYSPNVQIISSAYIRMLGLTLLMFLVLGPFMRIMASWLPIRSGVTIPFYFVGSRTDVVRSYQSMCLFGNDVLKPVGRFVRQVSEDDSTKMIDDIGVGKDFELAFERQSGFKGTTDDLWDAALRDDVYWLFVVRGSSSTINQAMSIPRDFFPQVIEMSSAELTGLTRGQIMNFGSATGIRVEECLLLPSSRFIKRAMDVMVSLTALLCLLPLILFLFLAIKLTNHGPVFFSQERIGLHGKRFRALKFRSMKCNANEELESYFERHPETRLEWAQTRKLRKDPRITPIGHFIRRSSLDELPQLWNVLVGQMSLVGPRPIQAVEIAKYGETFDDYIRVIPGITGLWQISGRSNTTYAERLVLDKFYVRNWSIWFDIYILFRTLKTVATCEGAC